MTILRMCELLVVCIVASACVSDTRVGENDGTVGGTLVLGEGYTAPPAGDVYIVWEVSAGSPDYSYAWGRGTLDGDRFSVPLEGAPPPEAFNGDLAFGVIVLLDPGTTLPAGVIDDSTTSSAETALIGLATRHAIIYRRSIGTVYRGWEDAFPVGEYACGRAVDVSDTFDDFEPIDCAGIEIRVDDPATLEAEVFNWT